MVVKKQHKSNGVANFFKPLEFFASVYIYFNSKGENSQFIHRAYIIFYAFEFNMSKFQRSTLHMSIPDFVYKKIIFANETFKRRSTRLKKKVLSFDRTFFF
jgi:hypothetical protein